MDVRADISDLAQSMWPPHAHDMISDYMTEHGKQRDLPKVDLEEARIRAMIDKEMNNLISGASGSTGNWVTALFARIAILRSSLSEASQDLHTNPELQLQLITKLNIHIDDRLSEAVDLKIEELTARSLTDSLTGLRNRADFDQRLALEIGNARRYRRGFALLLFDLDRFKAVNDLSGHLYGDQLLIDVSRILRESLRHGDEAFRIGGDEFAAICQEANHEMGEAIAIRLEATLTDAILRLHPDGECGISWGAASFPAEALDPISLFKLADQRLYQMKKDTRRNRTASPRLK